ncbi:coagulation factor III, tissue factor a precursor [Danio rerio]|uniref:Tissue factor n=1 Tax=Danio rerio TaxID=7955 RepID=C7S6G4_DANRE|nr:coagulation factor IIIa precursor [Danio rerio]ABW87260.1 thromboplastin [Danio rerio]|eukprot:NP_001232896.1 tissue factor precursor [Danio rerio]
MDSNMRQITLHTLVLALVSFFTTSCASDVFPKAKNVSWSSVNFKSMLTWSPKPTNYSYTVEFSELSQDRERTPYCIRTMDTECDLTAVLKNLKAYYSADVLSEPMRGVSSDLVEFPHVSSGKFSPYHDTDIGRPEFKIEVSSDKRMTKLHVTDVPTALFDDQKKRLNIRDVFGDELQYKVIYRKAKSTGKKEMLSKKSIIEMPDLDRGVGYCFNVQAYLPSRAANKQFGELSSVHCSTEENTTVFEEYGTGVITGVIVFILSAIIVIVLVIVMCCRRRRRAENEGKEGLALNGL